MSFPINDPPYAKISPWEVTSLYQFQFFCCPQCVLQVNVFQVNRSVLLVQQKNKLFHHLSITYLLLFLFCYDNLIEKLGFQGY